MLDEAVFEKLRDRSKEFFKLSHHDRFHVERVYNMALRIAKEENANLDVVKAAALLHDIARAMEDEEKIDDHAAEGARMARGILVEAGFPREKIDAVVYCIEVHRFRESVKPQSLEAKVLQDADRLDILGAIGIARVFSRGGWGNKPIHDPTISPKAKYDGKSQTSINHIHEKILKVKDSFNTATAKKIAEGRHRFVEQFLDRFFKEWNGEM
jgi:uncharacterized protein